MRNWPFNELCSTSSRYTVGQLRTDTRICWDRSTIAIESLRYISFYFLPISMEWKHLMLIWSYYYFSEWWWGLACRVPKKKSAIWLPFSNTRPWNCMKLGPADWDTDTLLPPLRRWNRWKKRIPALPLHPPAASVIWAWLPWRPSRAWNYAKKMVWPPGTLTILCSWCGNVKRSHSTSTKTCTPCHCTFIFF